MSVRFIESCPTCGRRIHLRVALLGKAVECPHCHCEFECGARGAEPTVVETNVLPIQAAPDPLMERAERMLAETQPGT